MSLDEEFEATLSKAEQRRLLGEAVKTAERAGYIVHKPQPKDATARRIDVSDLSGTDRLKIAVVSCTHFGSKYQQPTALRKFCEYATSVADVDLFVHAGDFGDGPTSRHKNPQEVFKHDYDATLDYLVETLPVTGKPWKIISGNHDDWWTLDGGPDMVKAFCAKRDDAEYLGRSLGYLEFKNTSIEVIHLNTGTGYAYSYKPQKHIESLDPARKPNVALIGNFHKFCAIYYRNVLGIQLPSFQRQSAWMAGKSLVSEVGGVILEIGLTRKGLAPSTKFEVVYTFEPKENDWP
jgi:predicted phosphodiesterase